VLEWQVFSTKGSTPPQKPTSNSITITEKNENKHTQMKNLNYTVLHLHHNENSVTHIYNI